MRFFVVTAHGRCFVVDRDKKPDFAQATDPTIEGFVIAFTPTFDAARTIVKALNAQQEGETP